jgi:anti-sigma B factor antagonist
MDSEPPSIFAVDVTAISDGIHLVALDGEMDFSTAERIAPAVAQVLAAGPASAVFDLSRLTFIDSTGVKQLIEAIVTIRSAGGGVAVACPTRSVKRAFDILHVDDIVSIEESVLEAVALVEVQLANGGTATWLDR